MATTLYQFPVSHYCEKARWGLDSCGLPYRIRNLVPLVHVPIVLALSGGTQVPALRADGQVIAGSREILDHLAASPAGAGVAALQPGSDGSFDWEGFADAQIGPHVRRLIYFHLLDHPAITAPLLAAGQPAWVRAGVRAAYPLIATGMRKGMRIDARGAAISRDKLRPACSRVAARLATQDYLDGERFSRSDLAVAALLAPLYQPPGYGLQWPRSLPATLEDELNDFAELRDWVLGIYRQHRPGAAA